MNKTIIAERFSKAISTYPCEANVQRQIANKNDPPAPETYSLSLSESDWVRMRNGHLLPNVAPHPSSGRVASEMTYCPEMRYCCEDFI